MMEFKLFISFSKIKRKNLKMIKIETSMNISGDKPTVTALQKASNQVTRLNVTGGSLGGQTPATASQRLQQIKSSQSKNRRILNLANITSKKDGNIQLSKIMNSGFQRPITQDAQSSRRSTSVDPRQTQSMAMNAPQVKPTLIREAAKQRVEINSRSME